MRTLLRLGLPICAAVVVGASFLDWGAFDVDATQLRDAMSQAPFMNIVEEAMGGTIFRAETVTVILTGWEGSVTFYRLKVPNWVVAACAAAWTLLGWIGASGSRSWLAVALGAALYSLAHLGVFVLALHADGEIRPGSVAALVGSAGAAALSIAALARGGRR